jgi:L-ribulose-5-phosphate 3-epimerase
LKKSVNQWCFPNDWTWEQVLGLCKKAKFDAIELCIDYIPFFEAMSKGSHEGLISDIARSVGSTFKESKALTFDSPDSKIKELKTMLRDHGLKVSSLLTIAQFYYTLMQNDDSIWKKGIDLVKQLIDYAVQFGAPALLIVPGVITSTISYEYGIKRLEEAIWILKEDAEKKRVGLGIENIWGKIMYSPMEMREFVDKFNTQFVGVHFDVGNVIQYGYPDQWIRIFGKKRILNVHLKDYSEIINNIRGFTYLFQGSVPWRRVLDSLNEIGYDGYLIAEVPPYPFCPQEGIWDLSRKMDILINGKY